MPTFVGDGSGASNDLSCESFGCEVAAPTNSKGAATMPSMLSRVSSIGVWRPLARSTNVTMSTSGGTSTPDICQSMAEVQFGGRRRDIQAINAGRTLAADDAAAGETA